MLPGHAACQQPVMLTWGGRRGRRPAAILAPRRTRAPGAWPHSRTIWRMRAWAILLVIDAEEKEIVRPDQLPAPRQVGPDAPVGNSRCLIEIGRASCRERV